MMINHALNYTSVSIFFSSSNLTSTPGCNSVFSWEPRIPNPEPLPPIPEIAPQLSPALLVHHHHHPHRHYCHCHYNHYQVLYTIVPLLVIAVIIGASCYVYQHRKHARWENQDDWPFTAYWNWKMIILTRFSSLSSSREELPASPPTPTLTHRCPNLVIRAENYSEADSLTEIVK